MPHVIVKLWPGRSEPQKRHLADAITKEVMKALQSDEGAVSVSIEEIEPADWEEKVYRPDIADRPAQLYKKPGYTM